MQRPRGLLIYPRHSDNFQFQPENGCRANGTRSGIVPLGLITIAACMTEWDITLVDRNVEELTDEHLKNCDLVFTGAMTVHRDDVFEIMNRARGFGKRVVVGGPDATDFPEIYAGADCVVTGEGELSVPQLVQDFGRNEMKARYGANGSRFNLAESPVPRFDLLRFDQYQKLSIQITRGCPYLCEFCSVPEKAGRLPRLKTPTQVTRELQALYDLGYRGHIKCAEDNLIGNTKLIKDVLAAMVDWQVAHDYPFSFFSMLTLNVADDETLLRLLRQVGFTTVYLGLESPSRRVLEWMRKIQNTKREMVASVRKIQSYGMAVQAGFIFGTDEDTDESADDVISFVNDAYLASVGIYPLMAEPRTTLVRRLKNEGRLLWDLGELPNAEREAKIGINFIPVRDRGKIFADYIRVLRAVYSPVAYFRRVVRLALILDEREGPAPTRNVRNTGPRRTLGYRLKKLGRLLVSLYRQHPLAAVSFLMAAGVLRVRRPAKINVLITRAFCYLDDAHDAAVSIKDAQRVLAYLEQAKEMTPFHLTTTNRAQWPGLAETTIHWAPFAAEGRRDQSGRQPTAQRDNILSTNSPF
jgi:radical SAM superfamily enzyme YgiQ (UPF0313 family)